MEEQTDNNSFAFLNIKINNLTGQEALEASEEYLKTKRKAFIAFANVDVVIRAEADTYLSEILKKADLTLADGKPLLWISGLYKKPIREKVSGSDFVPRLCKMAEDRQYSVYLLGGAEGVAKEAAKNLRQQYPKLVIAGTNCPPYGFEKDEAAVEQICQSISDAAPDILIVCLGCPKQEKFIYENIEKYDAVLSVCAGATIDFLAGNLKRSPKWMSDIGLEWFFRFLMEPRRLFKRYFIDDMKIAVLMFKYWPRKR